MKFITERGRGLLQIYYNAFGVRSIFRGSQGALAYHPSARQNATWNQNLGVPTLREVIHYRMCILRWSIFRKILVEVTHPRYRI